MERKVLKRRIKGLAAFVLAVVMMFGSSISALAATDYNFSVNREGTSTTTMKVGDVLTKEDSIKSETEGCKLYWEIENGASGNMKMTSSGGGVRYFNFISEGEKYEVTAVTCGDYYDSTEKKMWITMVPYVEGGNGDAGEEGGNGSTDGEEGGSTGESGSGSTGESTEDTAVEDKESEEQIFTRELLARAAAAKAGDTVAIDATVWHSFSAKVLRELLSKEGVRYIFYYNYGGECFYITIPAGAVLEEGCEWYGPLKLNAVFGRTMIDKKDLHAAINK